MPTMWWGWKGKKLMKYIDLPNSEIVALIDEWIHSERDRAIMKRRWIDGLVFSKIAEEFDMSDKQVIRIVYQCEERLFKHINLEKGDDLK